jgi:DNA-binding PadR family transcriptional regulator
MRTSSTPGFDPRGFDLRDAVDGLREAFAPRMTSRPGPAGRPGFERAGFERAGRGDIRAAILLELTEQPMHGYQLIQAIEIRSGGAWKPSAGSVYPTLQLLADEDLVTVAQVGERKVYSLTEAGRAVAAEAADAGHPADSPRGRSGQNTVALASAGVKLGQALTNFAHNGTPEQTERAVAVVDEARRKLYAILAED